MDGNGRARGNPVNELMDVEDGLFEEMREAFRARLEGRLQAMANARGALGPDGCKLALARVVPMQLASAFGTVRLRVWAGYRRDDGSWCVPVRAAWGLAANQRLTPSLQRRLCRTAVETGSYDKAAGLAAEWGCGISADALRSCVKALGAKAAAEPLDGPCPDAAGKDDVLVLMMDGWMARHRGEDWGCKERLEGQERVRWNEIKSAVLYKLKDQVRLSPRRRALLSKHVVAVPAETPPDEFGALVEREAVRMGLGKARFVYVVMDGGVWLWNIFRDRFRLCAVGTLDFYHASQHLNALAAALFREDKALARSWCRDLLHSLKHSSPGKLFKTLDELLRDPPRQDAATLDEIRDASDYFANHRNHMEYAGAARKGLPIGSGSMESQCSQFQNRFKRRGQFWSGPGFAGLLEVAVRHQNGELLSLWAA
jgi:hypothetical protein